MRKEFKPSLRGFFTKMAKKKEKESKKVGLNQDNYPDYGDYLRAKKEKK